MYVVKYVSGGAGARLEAASDGSQIKGLLKADELCVPVLARLDAELCRRQQLQGPVAALVRRWVVEEMRFAETVVEPSVAARFCRQREAHVAAFVGLLGSLLGEVLAGLPEQSETRSRLTWQVSVIGLISDPRRLIDRLVSTMVPLNFDSGQLFLGAATAQRIVVNMLRVSGVTDERARLRPKSVVWPRESSYAVEGLLSSYLGGTELSRLLQLPVNVNAARRLIHTK